MTGAEAPFPCLDEGTLDELYQWLEAIPLSRPRRNLPRDFSDGGTLHLTMEPGIGDRLS